MKTILAIGASNSENSINRKFAFWAANQVEGASVDDIDLNDYEMPIFKIDREKENGIPQLAHDFKEMVKECDGIVISFAEHNGSFSAAFKNVYDWISRIGAPIWGDKPMMILATSPGKRGGMSVLETAEKILPHRGAKISGVFSLPSFKENFENGITNPDLTASFNEQLSIFRAALDE